MSPRPRNSFAPGKSDRMSYESHAAPAVPAAISNAINMMRLAMPQRLPARARRAEASQVQTKGICANERQKARRNSPTGQKLHVQRVETERPSGVNRPNPLEIAVFTDWL